MMYHVGASTALILIKREVDYYEFSRVFIKNVTCG